MRKLTAPTGCHEASVGTTRYIVDPDGTVQVADEDAVALYAAGFVDAPPEAPAE